MNGDSVETEIVVDASEVRLRIEGRVVPSQEIPELLKAAAGAWNDTLDRQEEDLAVKLTEPGDEQTILHLQQQVENQRETIQNLTVHRGNAEKGEFYFEEIKDLMTSKGAEYLRGRTVLEAVRNVLESCASYREQMQEQMENETPIPPGKQEYYKELEEKHDALQGAVHAAFPGNYDKSALDVLDLVGANLQKLCMKQEQQIGDMKVGYSTAIETQRKYQHANGELQNRIQVLERMKADRRVDEMTEISRLQAENEQLVRERDGWKNNSDHRAERIKQLLEKLRITEVARDQHRFNLQEAVENTTEAERLLAEKVAEVAGLMSEIEKGRREDVLSAKVSIVAHPASESDGDDRVAVVPLVPNHYLREVLQWATVITDSWTKSAETGFVDEVSMTGESLEEWEEWMRRLKAELDKVWEPREAVQFSRITWIRGSAIESAPPEVQEWVKSLASS